MLSYSDVCYIEYGTRYPEATCTLCFCFGVFNVEAVAELVGPYDDRITVCAKHMAQAIQENQNLKPKGIT